MKNKLYETYVRKILKEQKEHEKSLWFAICGVDDHREKKLLLLKDRDLTEFEKGSVSTLYDLGRNLEQDHYWAQKCVEILKVLLKGGTASEEIDWNSVEYFLTRNRSHCFCGKVLDAVGYTHKKDCCKAVIALKEDISTKTKFW